MKLRKCAAILVVSSFLLAGCSNTSTVKKDGKDVVASLSKDKNEKNIFADDIFEDIISTTRGKSSYFQVVLQQLLDSKFPIDEAMEKDAQQQVDSIKAYYKNQYGENADAQLQAILASSGFETFDDYRDAIVENYQKFNFLLDYVEKNFDKVYDDYYTHATPRQASIIKIAVADVENPTEQENAKVSEIKQLLSTDKAFGDIAKEYSDDTYSKQNGGQLGVVDTASGIKNAYGADVETKLLALNPGEVSDAIKGNGGYYFVTVTSTDKKAIKQALKKDLTIDSPLIAYDSYLPYIAYQSHDVKYEDKQVKKLIDGIISDAMKERETSRKGAE